MCCKRVCSQLQVFQHTAKAATIDLTLNAGLSAFPHIEFHQPRFIKHRWRTVNATASGGPETSKSEKRNTKML